MKTLLFILLTVPVISVQVCAVVINEMMIDPTPPVGLPEYEFIELYNESTHAQDLSGWSISAGQYSCTLPRFILQPGAYVIVAPTNARGLFDSYGNVLYCSHFPALNNDGKRLTLHDSAGISKDVVEYSVTWYGDNFKENGGWTLERISPFNTCPSSSNWTASTSSTGGTPGQTNSTFQATTQTPAPRVTRIFNITDSSITLEFSQPMDSSTVFDRTQYSINKSLGSPAAIKSTFPEYSTITILTGSLLSKGQKYTITLGEGISSCSGQTLEKQTLDFAITELPEPGDITINELLFNAREDSTEFIELVNISRKALDIGALALANRDLRTGNIKNVVSLLPFANLVFPGQYIVFTKNEKSLNDYYKIPPDARIIPIPKMPSLPDDEGRICILSASGSIIDEFHYHDNMHFELLQSTDGVSLEKINLRRPSSIKTNWHSASSTAGYATPGYTNSQSITDSSGTSTFALNKQNFSPDNDGIDDLLQLNYSFPCPGYEATVTIFNTRGFLMKRLLTNELMETTGIITWDGTNDQGDVLPPGIYFITCKAFNTKASTLFAKWSCTLSTR